MSDILKIAIVQFDVKWHAIKDNILTIDSLINQLSSPVDLILLPEMFLTGFTMEPELFTEVNKAFVLDWMRSVSKTKNASVLGTHPWRVNNFDFYNRLISVSPEGNIDHYDKRHLFSIGKENGHYKSGNERKIISLNGWKIFPVICYDIRFPVWCRNNLDYDLMINLANWPASRNYAWDILLKARAIENQSFVIGVNRIGRDKNDIEYIGNSKAISMNGEIIKQLDNSEQLLYLELDLLEQKEFRIKFPFLKDQDPFSGI